MRFLGFLFLTSSLFAGQSLVLNQSTSVSFADPSYPVDSPWTVELQIDHWEQPGGSASSTQAVLTLAGVGFRLQTRSENYLAIYDLRNTYASVGGFTFCRFAMASRSNVLIRAHRTATQLVCEMWNVDGTGYEIQTRNRTATGSTSSGGTLGLASVNTPSIHIAFVRVFEKGIPTGWRPPATADVGDRDWKFDGNGTATAGGNDINTSNFAFDTTDIGPVISAAINKGDPRPWMPFGPLRAGHVNHIKSNSYTLLDDTAEVECFWQQIPHAEGAPLTSRVTFRDRTSCDEPGVDGLVHGPYKFRLTVRDSEGHVAQAERAFGAVAYDDKGVVIYPDERLNVLLGPMKVLGGNDWENADRQNILMAQNNWPKYKVFGGTWEPEWLQKTVGGVERQGTIYRVAGQDSQVYGTGTNFTQIFCGGDVGPATAGRHIILYRPNPYPREVSSCQSDTEITLKDSFQHDDIPIIDAPGTEYWGTYGFCSAATCGQWIGNNNQSNVNFYDNALAHYRLYYQSGWYEAHIAARWVADHWITNPWNRIGNQSRDIAYVGLMIRLMIDGGLEKWAAEGWDPLPAVRTWVNSNASCGSRVQSTNYIGDVRETSYCLIYKSVMAMLDPDETYSATAKAQLANGATARWQAQQGPLGNYFDGQLYDIPPYLVHYVEHGSRTVTKHSGSDFPTNYCGVVATDTGTITIDADRITIRGVGTDFTGLGGKYMYITGYWQGKPWAQATQVSSSTPPTETELRLAYRWRGDSESAVLDWAILDTPPRGDVGRLRRQFYATDSTGARTSDPIEKEWYWCRRVSATEIELDRPYQGDTSETNYRRYDGVLQVGLAHSQPFYHGIMGYGMYLAWEVLRRDEETAEAAEVYRSLLGSVTNWLFTLDARNPVTKGMRYASVSSPACGGYGDVGGADTVCWGTTPNTGRSYNIEVMGAMAFNHLIDAGGPDQDAISQFYTDTYARAGYASPLPGDGNYAEATDIAGWGTSDNLGTKNYGQAWGIGGGAIWPAVRLGGVAPPVERSLRVSVPSPLPYSADTVHVRVRMPNGQVVVQECESASCTIVGDFRQGALQVELEYRKGGNPVARSSMPAQVNRPPSVVAPD